MLSDLKYAFRQLAASPGFTAIAILTLALGIGLNAAMFNIVNSLVFQPLKFPDPDAIFRLQGTMPPGQQFFGYLPSQFVLIARESMDFARIACMRSWSFTIAEPNKPAEVLPALRTSPGYFQILGAKMELGREFLPDEDQPGRNMVVILGHDFWRSHFDGDPGIVGRTVRIDGQPTEVVGVAPAVANDPRLFNQADIYRPLALTPGEKTDRVDHAYTIIGRYRPGVTASHAAARLAAVAADLAAADPKEYAGRGLGADPLNPGLQGAGRQIVFMLIGLSGFVLLIACANLANLLLARAIARTREFAIRGALGASRSQLIRPLAAECALLSLVGCGCGIMVCDWTNDWLAQQFQASGSVLVFTVDWRLLLFAFGASLATALFFGIAPAWLVSHVRINEMLKSGARGATGDRSHNRYRQVLIAGQFALALVLLSGAVLFVRGLDQVLSRNTGWQPTPLLRGVLALPEVRYADAGSMMRFYEKVQERVSALPGVAAAAISHEVPAFYFPSGRGFLVEGQPPPDPNNVPGAPINGVTPGYFNTVGTHLLRGRDFTPTDRIDSPRVIIVSETLARTLFPGQEAIGRRLADFNEKEPKWMEIVGIVEDVQFINPGGGGRGFQAYMPLSQVTWSYVILSVRASVPPSTLVEPIRRAVSELDPDMAVKELMPVPAYIRRTMQNVQAIDHLLIGFALLGLFLAALGIYGVIARLVAQRTGEIGIRMALGAQVGQIARLILASGMRMALIGMGLGLLGAVALSRILLSALPGLATNSTIAIAFAIVVLAAIALLACYLPARRATRVDPIIALRAE